LPQLVFRNDTSQTLDIFPTSCPSQGRFWRAKNATFLGKWLAALDDFRNWLIREAA
jgi:hypothetical protein